MIYLTVRRCAELTAGGALVGLLLKCFLYGHPHEQMATGHHCGLTGDKLLCRDGAHLVLHLGELKELLGDKQGECAASASLGGLGWLLGRWRRRGHVLNYVARRRNGDWCYQPNLWGARGRWREPLERHVALEFGATEHGGMLRNLQDTIGVTAGIVYSKKSCSTSGSPDQGVVEALREQKIVLPPHRTLPAIFVNNMRILRALDSPHWSIISWPRCDRPYGLPILGC